MDSTILVSYFEKYTLLDYVIAYGSMGREETPCVKDQAGNVNLYNDLDLILVTEEKVKIALMVPKIKKEIKELFGVKWVDLLIWDNIQLRKKRNTIFYYDLCFKHLAIKGSKKDLAKILVPFPQKKISTYDFYCMYQTRMWAAMSLLIGHEGCHEYSEKKFQSYQCAKAILAVCDFTLLSRDAYTPIVAEKQNKMLANVNGNVDKFLFAHLHNAVKVKLNPDLKVLDYFIDDESLVLELLSFYQVSFMKLLGSRHLVPSVSLLLAVLRMNVSVAVKTVLLRDKRILERNFKRKTINRMFELESSGLTSTMPQRHDKLMLLGLLKDLSE